MKHSGSAVTLNTPQGQCARSPPIQVGWKVCVRRRNVWYSTPTGNSFGGFLSFVRYDDIDDTEHEDELKGRISYVLGGEAKCVRERYIRVAAIVIVTSEGNMNICVSERHKKPVASAVSCTKGLTISKTSDIWSLINQYAAPSGRKQKEELPFRFKIRNSYGVKQDKRNEMHNKASQTYCLREFCDGGNSEPNDTLKNIKCIS